MDGHAALKGSYTSNYQICLSIITAMSIRQTAVSSEGAKSTYIGAGVYPTLALFNHSCDPAIVRYYVEDYVVVQVIGKM